MTRINTNVSSLNAQKTLARSNMQLNEALTRLSTGLRINVGKDDPAGLIASEVLRSDIISVERAITNSERANQMIATADSALGQVSSLLNDIRGLVSEAANTGAMSAEQLSANQLQVDSSLEAIDRIAQVTSFQGKKLLDGNLDFLTDNVDNTKLTDLQIDQANFGTLTEIDVTIEVAAQAEKAQLTYAPNTTTTDVVLEIGGTNGFEAFSFAANSSIDDMAAAINLVSDALGITATVASDRATADTKGHADITSVGSGNDISITADTAGNASGDIAVIYTKGAAGAATAAAYTAVADGTDRLEVTLGTTAWKAATNNMAIGGVTINGLTAKISGTEFNDVKVVVDDAAAGATSGYYDHSTKTIHMAVSTQGSATALNAAVAGVLDDPRIAALFSYASVAGAVSTLSATGTATTTASGGSTLGGTVASAGTDGGVISATANDVLGVIGADAASGAGYITDSGGGTGLVTEFAEYARYGTINSGAADDTNDYLQFLAPSGTSELDFQFVAAAPSQSLSVTLDKVGDGEGYSYAIVQGANSNASFKLQAKNQGTGYDGVKVKIEDSASGNGAGTVDYAVWNPETEEFVIGVDTGAGATAQGIVDFINSDDYANVTWEASVFGSTGTGTLAATGTVGTTDNGNPYTGITVNLATDADGNVTTTAKELVDFVNNNSNGLSDLGISVSLAGTDNDGSGTLAASEGNIAFTTVGADFENHYASGTTYNQDGTNARLAVRALTAGQAYDDVKIVFEEDATVTNNAAFAYDDASKTLTVSVKTAGTTTAAQVVADFTAANFPEVFQQFDIQLASGSDGSGAINTGDTGKLTGGYTNDGNTYGVNLIENYDEGDQIGTSGLVFESTAYGSDAFVSVKALEGTFALTDADGNTTDRDTGADVDVRVNGIKAIGEGLKATLNTSSLDLSFNIESSVTADSGAIEFQITGGGAQFQLGPDVVSNQQARLGIQSLSTAKLGGPSGRLFKLRSGGDFSLTNDTASAAAVVDEVITQVTTLRGRLGAFQKTTLETNINSLNDTLEALTDAESSIRDADFAKESAALTRAQILVQSGVSVLSMANSNPQNVLALLR